MSRVFKCKTSHSAEAHLLRRLEVLSPVGVGEESLPTFAPSCLFFRHPRWVEAPPSPNRQATPNPQHQQTKMMVVYLVHQPDLVPLPIDVPQRQARVEKAASPPLQRASPPPRLGWVPWPLFRPKHARSSVPLIALVLALGEAHSSPRTPTLLVGDCP